LRFGLALVVEGARLWLVVRRWSFAGLPLPAAWAPRGKAYESAEGGRFNFPCRDWSSADRLDRPLPGLARAARMNRAI